MAPKHFNLVTEWDLDAPVERVWSLLTAIEEWPLWWRAVKRAELLQRGDANGLGSVHRITWKTALPYQLTFDTSESVKGRVVDIGEVSGSADKVIEEVADLLLRRVRRGTPAALIEWGLDAFDVFYVPARRRLLSLAAQLVAARQAGLLRLLLRSTCVTATDCPSQHSDVRISTEFNQTRASLSELFLFLRHRHCDLKPLPASQPPAPALPLRPQPCFLFIFWTSRHRLTMAPVVSALLALGNDVSCLQVVDVDSPELQCGGATVQTVRLPQQSPALKPFPVGPSFGLSAFWQRILHPRQSDITSPDLHQICHWCTVLSARFKADPPDAVIVGNDSNPFAVCALRLAERQGIRTIHCQHGAWVEGEVVRREVIARQVLVMGPYYTSMVAAWPGAERACFRTVGQARFDVLAQTTHRKARRELRTLLVERFDDQTAVITLIAQPQPLDLVRQQFLNIAAAIGDLKGTLLIAPHPAQPPDLYIRLLTELLAASPSANITVLPPSIENRQAWAGSDVVITYYSTAAIEAIIAGVPVIEQRYLGTKSLNLASWGVALPADSAHELPELIMAALAPRNPFCQAFAANRRAFLTQVCCLPRRGAAALTAETLIKAFRTNTEKGRRQR